MIMEEKFNTILIPVDFTVTTGIAIESAKELLKDKGSIHLMYVQSYSYPALSFSANRFILWNEKKDYRESMTKLLSIKTLIEAERKDMNVTIEIDTKHSIQEGIRQAVQKVKADVVIIGKKIRYRRLPFLSSINADLLARQTGKAVMTVRPGSINGKIKKVLVPLAKSIDEKKLETIRNIVAGRNSTIFLVGFTGKSNQDYKTCRTALEKASQWINDRLNKRVETLTVPSKVKPENIIKYAEKIGADLIVLKTGSECNTGWLNERITDLIPPSSHLRELVIN